MVRTSWVDNLSAREWSDVKAMYVLMYSTLGITQPPTVAEGRKSSSSIRPELLGPRITRFSKIVKNASSILRGINRQTILRQWRWICRDDPDKVLARYLKQFGDLEESVLALTRGIKFLCTRYDVEKLLATPEEVLMAEDAYSKIAKSGIRDICGKDKLGRPISVLLPGRNRVGVDYGYYETERFALVMHEFMLRCSDYCDVDGCVQIYQQTNVSRKLVTPKSAKFIAKRLRDLYPGLGSKNIFHNTPSGYKLVSKLLTMVFTRAMLVNVVYTTTLPELLNYVSIEQLPDYLGGCNNYKFEYIPPSPEDDLRRKDLSEKNRLQQERAELLQALETLTLAWVDEAVPETRHNMQIRRRELISELRANYEALDPFIRHRTTFDRMGILASFIEPSSHESDLSLPQSRPQTLSETSSRNTTLNEQLEPTAKVHVSPPTLASSPRPLRHISTFAQPNS